MKPSMLDALFVKRTGAVKPKYQPLTAVENIIETEKINLGFATQDEYIIELKLMARFWANDTEYEYALDNTRKLILRELFKPILNISMQMRHAAQDGDYEIIMQLAEQLDTECGL